jgi:hypothetical protein
MVKQDKPDALYMYPPISPLLPPQLTSLFLPSPYRLHRDGSALLEAEANSLLFFLFFIPRRK